MEDRTRVWAIRILAPIAFLAAATVLVIVVQRALDDGSAQPGPAGTAVSASSEVADTGAAAEGRRYYRIKEGDTLEAIASRFDTTVEGLLQLNPGIDPLALTPGQRIRVE